jgi:prepilin-type N-terminal cleavage/methylation domain-containing protein
MKKNFANRNSDGFSLIELLVVVAIILIVASIAIPNYMRSRIAANEASASQSLRAINTAETTYGNTYATGFAPLANLGGPAPCVPSPGTACIIDSLLSAGTKSGYVITTLTPGALGTPAAPNPRYSVNAVPLVPGQTGTRSFCTDDSNVIRTDPIGGLPPNPCSTSGLNPIQ